MSEAELKPLAAKVNKCVSVRVDCDFRLAWFERRSIEEKVKALESRIKDFEYFLKDHRSQDDINLSVIREYEDQCSLCGDKWEIYKDEVGKPSCASCGADIA